MDERQLIDRCIRGETGAWDRLVREYGSSVHDAARFTLRRVLGSAQEEDIENVYQGVLLGLCDREAHRLKLFQNRSSFRTWVTSVTVRFALNYIRTEKRKGSLKYLALDAAAAELPDRLCEHLGEPAVKVSGGRGLSCACQRGRTHRGGTGVDLSAAISASDRT